MRKFLKVSKKQFKKDFEKRGFNFFDKLYNDIKKPRRATMKSAGYDFYSPGSFTLKAKEEIVVPTGIKVQMLNDEFLGLQIRSSLGFKYNVRLKNSEGIIDADYIDGKNEGHIMVALYNHGDEDLEIEKGEAFAQGIFAKFLLTVDDKPVEEKRKGGMGSTNKKKED